MLRRERGLCFAQRTAALLSTALLLSGALSSACARPTSRAAQTMPPVQCMTRDGTCPERRPPREDRAPLERAHREAPNRESREVLCRDARRAIEEVTLGADRRCNAASDCMVIDVLECGSAVRHSADVSRLERRWREYRRVCDAATYDCVHQQTTCDNGRCELGLDIVRN